MNHEEAGPLSPDPEKQRNDARGLFNLYHSVIF